MKYLFVLRAAGDSTLTGSHASANNKARLRTIRHDTLRFAPLRAIAGVDVTWVVEQEQVANSLPE